MGGVTDQPGDSYRELEQRVRALEQAAGSSVPPPTTAKGDRAQWWVLERLSANEGPHFERDGVVGSVVYGGLTTTPGGGELAWQGEHPLPDVLDADLPAAALVFAALGHPMRLQILRHLLLGEHTVAELQQIPHLGTRGQLHHHLRELRTAGLVIHSRNNYTATPDRVVPWLVMIAAAAGSTVPTSTPRPHHTDKK